MLRFWNNFVRRESQNETGFKLLNTASTVIVCYVIVDELHWMNVSNKWSKQDRNSWRDRVDAEQLTRLTWHWGHLDVGPILMTKMSYYSKKPFCSCVSNNPIWRNFIFFSIAVVNILLFFDCGRLFIKYLFSKAFLRNINKYKISE